MRALIVIAADNNPMQHGVASRTVDNGSRTEVASIFGGVTRTREYIKPLRSNPPYPPVAASWLGLGAIPWRRCFEA
jgi:hypothetical protein